METIRSNRRLLSLILLVSSGSLFAVELAPEQQSAAATQQTGQAEQRSTIQRLNAMVGQLPTVAVTKAELTVDDQKKIATNNQAAASGKPLEAGVVKSLPVSIDFQVLDVPAMTDQTYSFQGGTIRRTAGNLTWVMRLDTAAAAGARLHFEQVSLPQGAAIHVYDDGGALHTYPGSQTSFWSHTFVGTQLYIQVVLPDQSTAGASFRISGIMLLDATSKAFCPDNAACIQDASCYGTDNWAAIDKARKAIAHYNFIQGDGSYICSGGLLADTDTTTTIPYFLTANHCVDNAEAAATLETWFNYQTSSCNATCPTRGTASTLGATLLQHSAVDDHSLLILDEDPPAEAWYLGWTTDAVASNKDLTLYRISHPLGSPQAYSTHHVDEQINPAQYCGTDTMPRGPFIFSRNLVGATEGGSSGSPLVDANGMVVGQLFGVCGFDIDEVCDSVLNATVDGAFANYYKDVAKWLNPNPLQLPLTVQKFGTGEGRIVASVDEASTATAATSTAATQAQTLAQAPTGGAKVMLAGSAAVEHTDWPWQAALKMSTWQVNDQWTCGGSVIAPTWILTAAHCVINDVDTRYTTISPSNIQVRVGSNRFEYGGQAALVKRIVKHPFFDPTTRDNDIALLELTSPVYVDPIRPVTLEREGTLACLGTAGVITGWTAQTICGNPATVLSAVNAKITAPATCRSAYPSDTVTGNMICSEPATTSSTLCQADDGSPLAVGNGRGGYVQAGIVSWGNSCETPKLPTVYTRVANYVDWLQSVTKLDLTSDVGTGVVDCGSTCSASYASGTLVTLTATASPGSTFAGWAGACTGATSTCQVTMSQARNVKATFDAAQLSSQSCAY